ncbi:hypothetical protein PPL_06272 [Heterostelium album PN500]|uniref:Glutathione S-transferase n=1 Tax=Heterostelium pallidum (strain ATCC 26659 / Pp 5 / PN500) TaxID=670386 RepID=D3BCP6_HETP5|nr:hypothetical protein PPL_06272 [Heterostelium album PN500]EFA80688.1 hypothetical protein PPL_06272 [Heterostelium album PN500]|eukprot:XP_020432808.1 hypothetical protein PPL_06272 [Heterostelium album PN500]
MSIAKKIELYGASTPNVHKVLFALEELNIPYNFNVLNLRNGDQFSEEFKKINPNSKVPAIFDPNVEGGLAVFESGNILQYLATRYGNGKYLPNPTTDIKGNTQVLGWLYWQMSGLGPTQGNLNHFNKYAPEKIEYALKRYSNELSRLLHVLEKELKDHTFIVGDQYTIADMAIYGWIRYLYMYPEYSSQEFPNLFKYMDRVRSIPSVNKVVTEAEEDLKKDPQKPFTDEERKIMFGQNGKSNQN